MLKGGVSISKLGREEPLHGFVEERKKSLLLILDETQRLADREGLRSDKFHDACDLIESIHNGEMGKPVLLLAAGLWGTEDVFEKLGISRMLNRCFTALAPLEKEAERAVIKDVLVRDGGAKGDPSEWMNAIASKAHGWPKHIISYRNAAAELLRENNGFMTPALLDRVFDLGGMAREDYYQRRAEDCSKSIVLVWQK